MYVFTFSFFHFLFMYVPIYILFMYVPIYTYIYIYVYTLYMGRMYVQRLSPPQAEMLWSLIVHVYRPKHTVACGGVLNRV